MIFNLTAPKYKGLSEIFTIFSTYLSYMGLSRMGLSQM